MLYVFLWSTWEFSFIGIGLVGYMYVFYDISVQGLLNSYSICLLQNYKLLVVQLTLLYVRSVGLLEKTLTKFQYSSYENVKNVQNDQKGYSESCEALVNRLKKGELVVIVGTCSRMIDSIVRKVESLRVKVQEVEEVQVKCQSKYNAKLFY